MLLGKSAVCSFLLLRSTQLNESINYYDPHQLIWFAYGLVLTYVFISRGEIPKWDFWVMWAICLFKGNWQIVFQNGCATLLSPQQHMRVLVIPHPCQHRIRSVFLILATLVGMKYRTIVVLTCASLMTHDVEHIFTCLSALCISSLAVSCLNLLPI